EQQLRTEESSKILSLVFSRLQRAPLFHHVDRVDLVPFPFQQTSFEHGCASGSSSIRQKVKRSVHLNGYLASMSGCLRQENVHGNTVGRDKFVGKRHKPELSQYPCNLEMRG